MKTTPPRREARGRDGADAIGSAAFTLLLLFLALGPILCGEPGGAAQRILGGGAVAANTVLCVVAFLIAALTFLSGSSPPLPGPLTIPLGATAGLALLGLVQLLPLPGRVLEAIAPANAIIYHETAEILTLFGRAAPAARISVAPGETIDALLLLGAYTSLALSCVLLLQNRRRRRIAAAVLLGSALVQIVAAAALDSEEDRVRGLFANPDHLAGYLEIALAVSFAVLWAEILVNRERGEPALERAERFERRFPALAMRAILWALVGAGIVLTQSRGGILAAAAASAALFAAGYARQRSRSKTRLGAGAAVAVLLAVLFVGVSAGAPRFSRFLNTDPRDLGGDTRVVLWRASFAAWREFPIVGSGLGTFREAFRRVQPRELKGVIEQAHNDFLQLAVTGGGVGAALGVVLFLSTFVVLFRGWRRQRHREESAYALGGLGALLALGLHGLVEFNLSVPVIPATLACVLGMSWAAAKRS